MVPNSMNPLILLNSSRKKNKNAPERLHKPKHFWFSRSCYDNITCQEELEGVAYEVGRVIIFKMYLYYMGIFFQNNTKMGLYALQDTWLYSEASITTTTLLLHNTDYIFIHWHITINFYKIIPFNFKFLIIQSYFCPSEVQVNEVNEGMTIPNHTHSHHVSFFC